MLLKKKTPDVKKWITKEDREALDYSKGSWKNKPSALRDPINIFRKENDFK